SWAAQRWFIGTPDAVAERLREFATRWQVDEVMISPVAAAHDSDAMNAAPSRLRTLELLAPAA
ncbi:MAG: LLM class flavin-dependent oxidoreductase, partial [Micrococcales bacterium]|nr:LLM class flavin-dependent oxidoreductase [Micrococcales bacterium]